MNLLVLTSWISAAMGRCAARSSDADFRATRGPELMPMRKRSLLR